jgi:spore coat polysaccharide biosynthesis protein SpsF
MVVAVPYTESDDPVADEVRAASADVVRGSEDDVLARFVQALFRYNLDIVVRLTADNPFVEGDVIDAMIERFRKQDVDYLHNVRGAGYPLGTSVEVVRSAALTEAFVESDRRADHEHVTSYVYDTDVSFETGVFHRDEPVEDIRLTVDTEEDYRLVSWIYDQMESPESFELDDVLDLRTARPERFKENANVHRKSIHE